MGPNDNTKNLQETDIYAFGGIGTYNPSKRAAADPRLRPQGHWDRRANYTYVGVEIVCGCWLGIYSSVCLNRNVRRSSHIQGTTLIFGHTEEYLTSS